MGRKACKHLVSIVEFYAITADLGALTLPPLFKKLLLVECTSTLYGSHLGESPRKTGLENIQRLWPSLVTVATVSSLSGSELQKASF